MNWDARLTQRGAEWHAIATGHGQLYWRLEVAQWFDEREAGGRHHIYVETIDEGGKPLANIPFRVAWPSGVSVQLTNGYQGFDAGNFPMSPSRNEFEAAIADGTPSDRVTGLGMGADTPSGFNTGIHTGTLLVFQRAHFGGETPEPPTLPDPPTPPPGTPDPLLEALYDARQAIDVALALYIDQVQG